jgi:taurine--2-oxoglutarate transaminase
MSETTGQKMSAQQMVDDCLRYSLYSWSATGKVAPLPVERAEGVYLYTPDGQRVLDFNSQLMSVNIGHSHPRVVRAMQEAATGLIYAYPGSATEVRARLSRRLAELSPGHLNTFFYTLGGAEANESAIKAVRLATGRQKILSRYRSYHGGTNATLQLTGDQRRLANEPGMPGVIRVLDPRPYRYSFGRDDAEVVANNLTYLAEIIDYEGPQTIAAMFIETVTGTNGILPPPAGYLQGLKALLDSHGILLVCDEVMAGWGRTGKRYAFEHGGIVPDICTMAKGLTSSYVPLGCMAVSDRLADYFRENVFWGGLTYNAHPFCLAVAMAVLDVMEEEDLVGNAARMEAVVRREMDALAAKHPSVAEGRVIGLFGTLDLRRNAASEPLCGYGGSHPVMGRLASFLRQEGLFTFLRPSGVMVNPPLCITEEQIQEGFAILDRGLALVDEVFEG